MSSSQTRSFGLPPPQSSNAATPSLLMSPPQDNHHRRHNSTIVHADSNVSNSNQKNNSSRLKPPSNLSISHHGEGDNNPAVNRSNSSYQNMQTPVQQEKTKRYMPPVSLLSSQDRAAQVVKMGGHGTKAAKALALPPPYNKKIPVVLPRLRNTEIIAELQTPVTSEYKVNEYYNYFMREHFLVDEIQKNATSELSSKLKQRLQNRTSRFNSTSTTSRLQQQPRSALLMSPDTGDSEQFTINANNRLTEMKEAAVPYSTKQSVFRTKESVTSQVMSQQQSIIEEITPNANTTGPEIGKLTPALPPVKDILKRKSAFGLSSGEAQSEIKDTTSQGRQTLEGSNKPGDPISKQVSGEKQQQLKQDSQTKEKEEQPQTYYLFEAQDYQHQKRLGEFTLSKNENFLEKGGLLYDATKVMQMTQFYIAKNLKDIFQKRKLQESMALSDQSAPDSIKAAREARQKLMLQHQLLDSDDQKLPQYLQDRRRELHNPLKDNRITFTEMRCIEKMQRMGKWDPFRDGDPGQPGMLKKVDSLVESVYNSEKNLEWSKIGGCPVKAPPPSELSDSDYYLFENNEDSTKDIEDEDWLKPPPTTNQNNASGQGEDGQQQKKLETVTPAKQQSQEQASPGELSTAAPTLQDQQSELKKGESDEQASSIDDYQDAIHMEGLQLCSVKHLGPYKVILKSRDQAKKVFFKNENWNEPSPELLEKIYNHYCVQAHAVPVRFLNLYQDGWLKMVNFNMQANMSLALAMTLPFMTGLRGVKFKNNGIRDDEAALLLKACSYCPHFSSFLIERNEVGEKFSWILRDVVASMQERFAELSLSQCRNFMKISSKVCQMACDGYLQHLDLSNTIMNYLACKLLGNLIKTTQRLQNLSLANCALRGTSAREVANALLFNQSLKFLNLSVNSFASRDYELASKIARMIQIHQSLIHLDLTSIQIRREEAMYIAQCLNDSSNIVSCHLTGNSIDYYSRLFLRSHLNAIVQYPMYNTHHNQNTILAGDRGQIVTLNHQLQLTIVEDAGRDIQALKEQDAKEQNHYYEDVIPELNEEDDKRYLTYQQDHQYHSKEGENIKGKRMLYPSDQHVADYLNDKQQESGEGKPSGTGTQLDNYQDNNSGAGVPGSKPGTSQSRVGSQQQYNREKIGSSRFKMQQSPRMGASRERSPGKQHRENTTNDAMLDRYLNDDKARIYDMLEMLDTYGFKRRAQNAKNDYMAQFPDTQLAKSIEEQTKRTNRSKQHGRPSIHIQAASSREGGQSENPNKAKNAGTISEQNQMARFIAGLVNNFEGDTKSNPMTGFLKEIIFTRFLNNDDVEHSQVWRDCNQCWICEKWDKSKVQFYEPDVLEDKHFQKLFDLSHGGPNAQGRQGAGVRDSSNQEEDEDALLRYLLEERRRKRLERTKTVRVSTVSSDHNQDFYGAEYLIKAEPFDKGIVEVRNSGPERVRASEVEDKVLFNQQISTVKVGLSRFQQQLVPTMKVLDQEEVDPQLVMHKECIPYRPFTKKAMLAALQSTCTPYQKKKDENALDNAQSPIDSTSKSKRSKTTRMKGLGSISENEDEEDWSEGLSSDDEEHPLNNEQKILDRKTRRNQLKHTLRNIFAEWWKMLPEITASGTHVDDIYLVASFNNWQPVRMDAWEKKLVLCKEKDEIEKQTKIIKERLLKLELPPAVLKDHIEKRYKHLSRNTDDHEESRGLLGQMVDTEEDVLSNSNNLKSKQQLHTNSLQASHNNTHALQPVVQHSSAAHTSSKAAINNGHNASIHGGGFMGLLTAAAAAEQKKLELEKQQVQIYRTFDNNVDDPKTIEGERIKTDIAYNFAKFIPSGKHYFYFVRNGRYYCLSERYPIKRFKKTNLFMNEIYLAAKTWRISDFDVGEVQGVRTKMKFDISKSVFRTFKLESEELLKKMFELDFKYTKIKKIFKNNVHECEAIQSLLQKNYHRLKNIFLAATLNSEYPVVSWNDFSLICNKCKIPDNKTCNLSTIDRIFIATNVNQNVPGQQGDRDLVRYEFLEIIVRIANVKYKDTGVCHTSTEALTKLLNENLFPNMDEAIAQTFRDQHLYTEEVNELLLRNEMGIKKLFGLFTHGQKRYMTVRDAIDLVNSKCELRFLDRQVIRQFGLSKMPHVDAINNPEFPGRMVYVEFLEFLGRIAFEVFRDHDKMKDEPLHLKIDALFTKLFKSIRVNKAFSFLENNRQNVIYEVVLNPQLGLQPGVETTSGTQLPVSDIDNTLGGTVKLNM